MNDPFPCVIRVSAPFYSRNQLHNVPIPLNAFKLIWPAAQQFKFPFRTAATAMILFQRFNLHDPSTTYPVNDIVATCLFVASKIEDTPKKTRDILTAMSTVISETRGFPYSPSELDISRNNLFILERQILEIISFDLRLRHPQVLIVQIIKTIEKNKRELGSKDRKDIEESTDTNPTTTRAATPSTSFYKPLAKLAWKISIDLYLTVAPLCFPAHTLALACIVLAAKLQDAPIFPLDSDKFLSSRQDVNKALLDLIDLYIHHRANTMLPDIDLDMIMGLRTSIDREVSKNRRKEETSDKTLIKYNANLSRKGSMRYVLDWEKRHVMSELTAQGL